eukprot:228171-Hanusia_phi.AAC.4
MQTAKSRKGDEYKKRNERRGGERRTRIGGSNDKCGYKGTGTDVDEDMGTRQARDLRSYNTHDKLHLPHIISLIRK